MSKKINWLSRELIFGPHMVLCLTKKEFHRVCAYLDVDVVDAGAYPCNVVLANVTTLQHKIFGVLCIVSLQEGLKLSRKEMYMVLTHEAVHVWQQTCLMLGENAPGAEIEAYAIQAIATTLTDEYDRRTCRARGKKRR